MKPEEALYHLMNHPGMVAVPAFYRDMPRHLLEALGPRMRQAERY